MPVIEYLQGLEILDSRGRPTVKATCALASGAVAQTSVPSGASTGAAEALELRDGDPSRYGGRGCRKAAGHVSQDLSEALSGSAFSTQQALDEALCRLDGTANKSRLGANAVVAVSLAFARAHALEAGLPLYEHLASLLGASPRLPSTHHQPLQRRQARGGGRSPSKTSSSCPWPPPRWTRPWRRWRTSTEPPQGSAPTGTGCASSRPTRAASPLLSRTWRRPSTTRCGRSRGPATAPARTSPSPSTSPRVNSLKAVGTG